MIRNLCVHNSQNMAAPCTKHQFSSLSYIPQTRWSGEENEISMLSWLEYFSQRETLKKDNLTNENLSLDHKAECLNCYDLSINRKKKADKLGKVQV